MVSPPLTARDRRFAFLLPPVIGAVTAALMPLPICNRLGGGGDWLAPVLAIAGLSGAAAGLLLADRQAPDGRGGWGRVAALWLGFVLLLPGAAAWGLHGDSSGAGYVVLAAAWVIFSALPLGRWENLSAGQCLDFSLRFYGIWLLVMLAVAAVAPELGGWVLAAAYLASAPLAAFLRRRLPIRPAWLSLLGNTPYPAARRRRFFAVLVPLQALAVYDFWSTFGGTAIPHFGGLLQALGVPHFPGTGLVGLFLVQLLPVFILVSWMRDGLGNLRKSSDLPRYVVMIYVVSTGCAWMALALIHQVSRWFFHPWMDDYPRTALIMTILLTEACGLFFYRLLLGMEVMAPSPRRQSAQRGR